MFKKLWEWLKGAWSTCPVCGYFCCGNGGKGCVDLHGYRKEMEEDDDGIVRDCYFYPWGSKWEPCSHCERDGSPCIWCGGNGYEKVQLYEVVRPMAVWWDERLRRKDERNN